MKNSIYWIVISLQALFPFATVGRSNWVSENYGICQELYGDWARISGKEMTDAQFNDYIDGIDVNKIADQVKESGASWYMMKVLKNKRTLCHSAKFDQYVGHTNATPDRDLVMDMYNAINTRAPGVKFGVYLSSTVHDDLKADFGWTDSGPSETYKQRWAEVIEELSDRMGDKIAIWWMDEMSQGFGWEHPTKGDDIHVAFFNAMKSGNSDALVAQNLGGSLAFSPEAVYLPTMDYLAGHSSMELSLNLTHQPPSNDGIFQGLQWHCANYAGSGWLDDYVVHDLDDFVNWANDVRQHKGAFTIWCGGGATVPGWALTDGSIPSTHMDLLLSIKTGAPVPTDDILKVTAPDVVQAGQSYTVTVDYEAKTNRDIWVLFQNQKSSVGYGSTKADVPAGKGKIDIQVNVDASTPNVGNAYQWRVLITKDSGTTNTDRFYHIDIKDVDCGDRVYSDKIKSVEGPETVTPGEVCSIKVEYEASQDRNVNIVFQKNVVPWTWYGSKTVTVPAGESAKSIEVQIDPNTPIVDDEYQWNVFITPVGGSFNDKFNNIILNNVDCITPVFNSLPEDSSGEMIIYPNPVKEGLLYLRNQHQLPKGAYTILDLQGRTIDKNSLNHSALNGDFTYAIDVSGFPSGIYALIIKNKNTDFTSLFLKQ